MKKIDNQVFKTYNNAKLYIDDLLEIIDIIKENSNGIKITINNFILEDNDDITKFTKEPMKKIEMRGNSTRFSFSYEKSKIQLYYTDDIISLGIFNKIEKILVERNRLLLSIIKNPVFYSFALLLSLLFGIIPIIVKDINSNCKSVMLVIQLSLLLVVIINMFVSLKKIGSIIYLEKKSNMPSFFSRQKDVILTNILSLLIGSGVTLLIEYLIKKK
jgi:hypothetical protein